MTQPKDFGFGPDEEMTKSIAFKLLAEKSPADRVRALAARDPASFIDGNARPECAYDEAAWEHIVELGWPALAVPERAGGVSMSMVGVAALVEEVGRFAFPSPLLSTLLAAFVLRECRTPSADAWLRKIAEGSSAAIAVQTADGGLENSGVNAEDSRDGAMLSGASHFVQDARKASFFVVLAKSAHGHGLYAVSANARGVSILPDRIADTTHDQARVVLDGASAEIVSAAPRGREALRAALPAIWTTLAADLVGTSEWLLQTTVEYAKVREQFGRPIGFFQAVKHPLVNVMIENDLSRSLTYNAACAIDTEPEHAERFARMAKAQASDAAALAADRAVQLHGGIGFTWECDVHIFFKRAKHQQFSFGDGRHHRRELAKILLGQPERANGHVHTQR